MAGNSPDEFEAVKQARKGVFDGLEVSMRDVFELAFKGGEKLYEVLGFGVFLVERSSFNTEILEGLVFLARVFGVQNLKTLRNLNETYSFNALDGVHAQLLIERVKGRRAGGPEFCFA